MKIIGITLAALLLTACGKAEPPVTAITTTPTTTAASISSQTSTTPQENLLVDILAAQSDAVKARYEARHPQATLEFFGIQPGMTVVEVLPGEGWYSQLLVPLLGTKGKLIGQDYDVDMWQNFSWVNDEFLEKRKLWPTEWVSQSAAWGKGATTSAFTISATPEALNGTVDAILFIRALHNLHRFENQGQHFSRALAKSYQLLKAGGILGIVQHQASEDKADDWANGAHGYLKKSSVIAALEKAGFEFVGETDINNNAKDLPDDDDSVWRLPPSLSTSKDNEELQQQYRAIGESNRMTLLFRKPA